MLSDKEVDTVQAFSYFKDLAKALHLLSMDSHKKGEPFKPISNSEIQRWMERGIFEVDLVLKKDWKNDMIMFPIRTLVLFPNNPKLRSTIFWDEDFVRQKREEDKVNAYADRKIQQDIMHRLMGEPKS